MQKEKLTKRFLGIAGVDSGQLLVCDPCYIDSQWEKQDFIDIQMYKHKKLKKFFCYNSPYTKTNNKSKDTEMFNSYEQKLSTKKTMNEMLAKKEVIEIPIPEKDKMIGKFSYGGICETTQNDKSQINYRLGHPGAGVVFSSGYGDGAYKVYGFFNKEGRCMKVEINMN